MARQRCDPRCPGRHAPLPDPVRVSHEPSTLIRLLQMQRPKATARRHGSKRCYKCNSRPRASHADPHHGEEIPVGARSICFLVHSATKCRKPNNDGQMGHMCLISGSRGEAASTGNGAFATGAPNCLALPGAATNSHKLPRQTPASVKDPSDLPVTAVTARDGGHSRLPTQGCGEAEAQLLMRITARYVP